MDPEYDARRLVDRNKIDMWYMISTYWIESSATIAVIPAIASFLYRKCYRYGALRYFFLYLVVKLVIDIAMLYMASKRIDNLYLGNILTIVGFFLVARMFQDMYEEVRMKRVVYLCEVLFMAIVSMDLIRDGLSYTFRYTGLFSCMFIMLFCLLYFYELIRLLRIPDLLTFPFFWICSSLLIYVSCCTFISPLAFYLDRWDSNRDMHIFVLVPYILESSYLCIITFGMFVSKS